METIMTRLQEDNEKAQKTGGQDAVMTQHIEVLASLSWRKLELGG